MSLATLKKKSEAKYKNLSTNQPHFSINGTHRSQGYVGQTSLSRSLPRTPMNGIYPRGHGGCCGFYPVKPIIQSAVTSVENPNVIKLSVISTKGMLEEKSKCITGLNIPGIPSKIAKSRLNIVKPDTNNHNNFQSNYIKRRAKMAIQNANKCTAVNQIKTKKSCALSNDSNMFNIHKVTCNFTKPLSDFIPISQGERMVQLGNQCVNKDITYATTSTTVNKKTPFACGI